MRVTRMVETAVLSMCIIACGGAAATLPATLPVLTGRWTGEESFGPAPRVQVGWVVIVTQAPNSPALLGTATAALEPPNFDMNGVVLGPTHVSMNFVSTTGRAGGRTFNADLTLSPDGLTLTGPIVPSVTTSPATLVLHRE